MKHSRLQWIVLITVIVGTFLGQIDRTIVNLAIPKMDNDFGISFATGGWIATAYMIANAVFVPIWGKLGDTIGRKKVYVMGFLIFIVGSVLAGLAWNFSSMIVFRIVQAIASSADYPTAMAILSVTFTDFKQRAQALGIWSASFASAAVLGPLVGGPLIDNFGWRSVFLINLPVGLIGLAMALAFINESVSEKKTYKFDWWGAFTLGGSLSALVLVLEKGFGWGWLSANSVICYLTVLILGISFYFIEKHHEEPMLDLKFFKIPVFRTSLINNATVFLAMMGSVFLIPIFSQTFMGLSATESGYLFIPMAVGFMFGAPIGGRFIGKVKASYIIAISTFTAGIGFFLFYLLLDPRSGPIDIIIPLSIMAFGLGLGMAQRTSLITNAVPVHEVGMASSALTLVRNISGAFGIAIFGTLVSTFANQKIAAIARYSTVNAGSPTDFKAAVALMELKAQVAAYGEVFLICAIVMIAAGFAAFFIRGQVRKPSASDEQVIVMD